MRLRKLFSKLAMPVVILFILTAVLAAQCFAADGDYSLSIGGSPESAEEGTSGNVIISGTVSKEGGGDFSGEVKLYLDGKIIPGGYTLAINTGMESGTDYSFKYNYSSLKAGTHTLSVRFFDEESTEIAAENAFTFTVTPMRHETLLTAAFSETERFYDGKKSSFTAAVSLQSSEKFTGDAVIEVYPDSEMKSEELITTLTLKPNGTEKLTGTLPLETESDIGDHPFFFSFAGSESFKPSTAEATYKVKEITVAKDATVNGEPCTQETILKTTNGSGMRANILVKPGSGADKGKVKATILGPAGPLSKELTFTPSVSPGEEQTGISFPIPSTLEVGNYTVCVDVEDGPGLKGDKLIFGLTVKSPRTADDSGLFLWAHTAAAALGATVYLLPRKKKEKV